MFLLSFLIFLEKRLLLLIIPSESGNIKESTKIEEGVSMDMNRVKQILSSPGNVRVEYHGIPVWIESCDEGNGIANVHDIKNPDETVEVKVAELEEI